MSESAPSGPVVVGIAQDVDPMQIDLAIDEAAARRVPIRLVHVRNPVVVADGATSWATPYVVEDVAPAAQAHLERTRARILAAAAAAVTVELVSESGDPASALLRHSSDASVIVLGIDRRLGSLLIGRTALRLAQKAVAPVLVARGERRTGPVVLAVPPTGLPERAVAAAFAEAQNRRARLTALRVVELSDADLRLPRGEAPDQEAELAEILAGHAGEWPDVDVDLAVHAGSTKNALLRESEDASILVMGSAAHGVFLGLALGSVAVAMLHHARCPVMVVRSERSGSDPGRH